MTDRFVQDAVDGSTSRLLEAIRTVNTSLRLPQVWTAIVDAVVMIAACDSASLCVSQDGVMRCVAVGGAGRPSEPLPLGHSLPDHWPPLRQFRAGLNPMYIADVRHYAAWPEIAESIPAADTVEAWLGIPLVQQDRLLGFVGIGYQTTREYGGKLAVDLSELAVHLSATLGNAMILSEESARARIGLLRASIQESLRDASRTEPLCAGAATAIGQALGVTWCGVYLGTDTAPPMRAATFSQGDTTLDGRVEAVLQAIVALVTHSRRTLAISDIARDPGGEASIRANRELLLGSGMCSLLISPLTLTGKVLGALVAIQTADLRVWESGEVMLIEQIAADMAVRIGQAQANEKDAAANAAIRSDRDALRAAAFQSPVAVLVADLPPHQIRFWNSAAVALARSGTLMSAPGQSQSPEFEAFFLDRRPYPAEQWPLTRAFRESVAVPGEECLLRLRDGRLATVLVSASPTTDHKGRVTGSIALIQDISPQRLEESRSAHALRRLQSLHGVLGHLLAHLANDNVEIDLLREVRRRIPFDAALVRIESPVPELAAYDAGGEPGAEGFAGRELSSVLIAAAEHLPVSAQGTVLGDLGGMPDGGFGTSIAEAGFHSAIAVPIVIDDAPAGSILLLDRRADVYGDVDVELAGTLGLVLGTCHAMRTLQEEYGQHAKKEERDRLARDIHDVLAQMVTSVVLQLERALQLVPEDSETRQILSQARSTARSAVAETRRIVWNLRSASVDLQDPRTVVQDEAAKLERRLSIKPEVIVTGEPRALAAETGSVVQRLTRVALDNIWSHSEARHVRLLLDYGLQVFTLLVEDDGKGFDPLRGRAARHRQGGPGGRSRARSTRGRQPARRKRSASGHACLVRGALHTVRTSATGKADGGRARGSGSCQLDERQRGADSHCADRRSLYGAAGIGAHAERARRHTGHRGSRYRIGWIAHH